MRSLTANILFCVSIAWTMAGGVSAQTENPDNLQVVHLEPFHEPKVTDLTHFGNCQWLYPLDEPNETLISEPAYGSAKRVYYAARYGDAKDNTYAFVIDESAGTHTRFDTLYVDLNNDNRLDPAREKFPLTLSGLVVREARNVRVTLLISAGGKTIPYAVDFAAFPYKDREHPVEKLHATCRDSSVMVGEALFEGQRYKVALADLNSNGLFNDYEQDLFRGDRFFVDLNGNGTFDNDQGNQESFPYAQYAKIGGRWYTVEASPDGGTARIRPSQPTFGTVRGPDSMKVVGLSSPKQFQRLDFKEGKAQALSGVYQVRDVTLEIVDKDGPRWSTRGQYRSTGPKIAIEPNQEAALDEVQPLTIQVAALPTSEANALELEPRIVDRHGGSFSTLRKNSERHEPPARLVIKDSDGKQIADAALEYG
jgi:hypothetical protein